MTNLSRKIIFNAESTLILSNINNYNMIELNMNCPFSSINTADMKVLLMVLLLPLTCTIITADDSHLIEVATSPEYQWNGVALTKTNRLFAGFPRSYQNTTISVGEILPNKTIIPIPGGSWNTFKPENSTENPQSRFVNVNAILIDSSDTLWVVDSGMVGSIAYPNASKLVKINLNKQSVDRIYYTSTLNLPSGFALNDVRIGSGYAYLTESGLGSLVMINLETNQVRRVLANHYSTKFSDPTVVRMEGRVVSDEKGQPKRMPNNNLELTPDQKIFYYKPSFSYNWFQISTDHLLKESIDETALGSYVSVSWKTMPTGGSTMDDQGFIYLMDLERQAIWQQNPTDGSWKLIVRDEKIIWGDASDVGQDGYLYVPMSQNNRIPSFNNGTNQVEKPFRMYKIKMNSAHLIGNQKIFIFFFFSNILVKFYFLE